MVKKGRLTPVQTLNKKVVIKIGDNGQGMPEELMEKIFIPFFTTKKMEAVLG